MILAIRTDKPDAELYLLDNQGEVFASKTWLAHRELSSTLLSEINKLVESEGRQLADIKAILVFKGPGSFTGLRIGITVANALGDGLGAPIHGSSGDQWLEEGASQLLGGVNDKIVMPEYGAEPNVTIPKRS